MSPNISVGSLVQPAMRGICAGLVLISALGCSRGDPSPPEPRLPTPAPVAASPASRLGSVLIRGVPHVEQKPDFCGEADVESFVRFLGHSITQDQVFGLSGMPPERGMGATTRELEVALEKLGFDPGPVRYQVAPGRSATELDRLFADLHADLKRGVPSIVCMHYDHAPRAPEHFRLVLGYATFSPSAHSTRAATEPW